MDVFSFMYVLAAVVFGLIGVAYIYLQHAFQYWKKKGIKFIKPSFPFGTSKDIAFMRKAIGDVYEGHYYTLKGEKYGGAYLLQTPQLLLRDPEVIKTFMVKDFEHFHDHGFASDQSFDPLSGNLFQLNGEKWKDLRNKLSPTFTSGKMKVMFQTVADCGTELKAYLEKPAENKEELDVKDVMGKFTTDVIASCAFGINSNCLKDPDAEFRYWGKRALETNWDNLFRQLMYLLMPSVALKLKIPSTPKDIENFFITMVRETVGLRKTHNVQRKDFLQLLIQLKEQMSKEGKEEMTLEEMTAQVFVFLVAGFETSSITLTFCLYELAMRPDIQNRLRTEIDTVLQKHDGLVTYDAIQEMSYLDKVVLETLRKNPPVPFLNRECTKEYKIPGTDVTLEEGVQVVIPVQALHYDPQYYPEPQEFEPERFSNENKSKRHHYTFLPFGEGPRLCIGMRFAQMQIKVGLVSLLTKYEFQVCSKTPIPLVKDPASFFNDSKGIFLRIRNRN